jgi:hypothetical protein
MGSHGPCAVSHDNLDQIADVARSTDVNGVRRMLAIYGRALQYNRARGALQLFDCLGNSVIASFPVTLELTEAL